MKLLLVHGWAFGPEIWTRLRAALELRLAGVVIDEVDLGYFGDPARPEPQEPVVALAHSFGAMWLLGQPPARPSALVAINGFDRFAEGDSFAGQPRRVLDRMMSRFDAEPQAVVGAFRSRCGEDGPAPDTLRPCRLREDLVVLRDGDERAAARAWPAPILSLQGGQDPIMSLAQREAVFAGALDLQRREAPKGGHLLPLSEPDWCAEQIVTFLQSVEAAF